MVQDNSIIKIQDDAFRNLMNKLNRIESFVKEVSRIVEEYNIHRRTCPENKRFLDADEACQILGVSRRTLDRYKKDGKIRAIQHGGKVRYDFQELINYNNNSKHKNTHTDFITNIISLGSTKTNDTSKS